MLDFIYPKGGVQMKNYTYYILIFCFIMFAGLCIKTNRTRELIACLLISGFIIFAVFCFKINKAKGTNNIKEKPAAVNNNTNDTEKRARALAKAASRYNGKQALGYISAYARNEQEMQRALEILTGKDKSSVSDNNINNLLLKNGAKDDTATKAVQQKEQQTAPAAATYDETDKNSYNYTTNGQHNRQTTPDAESKKETVKNNEQITDINTPDTFGETPLLKAIEKGLIQQTKDLIRQGADVNYVNNFNESALTVAIKKGYTETVKILIDSGADVNYKTKWGKSILQQAEDENNIEIIKLLKNAGAQ